MRTSPRYVLNKYIEEKRTVFPCYDKMVSRINGGDSISNESAEILK